MEGISEVLPSYHNIYDKLLSSLNLFVTMNQSDAAFERSIYVS
jgi:hypothetical protein